MNGYRRIYSLMALVLAACIMLAAVFGLGKAMEVAAQISVVPTPTNTPTNTPTTLSPTDTPTPIPPTDTPTPVLPTDTPTPVPPTDTPTPLPPTPTFTPTPAAPQQIKNVQVALDDLLTQGKITPKGHSMLYKRLDKATDKLDKGDTAAAIDQLHAFIAQAQELADSGDMDQGDADDLKTDAQIIINQLGG